MTEQSWKVDELDHIGDADELRLAPRRKNGTLRGAVPIQARATTLRLVPCSTAGA
jgi:hypothetical protein